MRRCWRRGRLRCGNGEGFFLNFFRIISRIVNHLPLTVPYRSERLGPERFSGMFRTVANVRDGKLLDSSQPRHTQIRKTRDSGGAR